MAGYSFKKVIKALTIGVLGAVGVAVGGGGAISQNVITPDSTLGPESSVVIPLGSLFEGIQGGAERGNNLFHSFAQFDIGANGGALFLLDSSTVDNIFARVSTQNTSDILGVLGTRQIVNSNLLPTPANLYLINPSGIIFGQNSTLDVGGSFVATTADSVLFSDGKEFGSNSTMGSLPSILAVNPSAYLFGAGNVSDLSVQSNRLDSRVGIDRGLSVAPRENLSFIGGNVNISGLGEVNGAGLIARGGDINLIAVREGLVSVSPDGLLSSSQSDLKGTITLSNNALIETSLDNGGNIFLSGERIQITASVVRSGILRGVGSQNSQAGDVLVRANVLSLSEGAQIDTSISGTGNAGNIDINALTVMLQGSRVEGVNTAGAQEILSALRSTVNSTGVGNGGDITIRTENIEISGGAGITTSTLGNGSARNPSNAGNIFINSDFFKLTGTTPVSLQPSSIQSVSAIDSIGSSGNVNITSSRRLLVEDGAGITTAAFGRGSVGSVQISSDDIVFRGVDAQDFSSSIDTRASENAVTANVDENDKIPDSITVVANNNLRLEDGAQLVAGTSNSADSGNISVTAQNFLIRGGRVVGDDRFPGGILTTAEPGSTGQAGDISVDTGNLTIEEGGALTARSRGGGIAGNISINASDQIRVSNADIDTISTQDSGGGVSIQTRALTLENDGDITTRAFQRGGTGGPINITAADFILAVDDSDIIAASPQGQGGNISLQTPGFFGIGFTETSLGADPNSLDGNNRVDVNASGLVNGAVDIPDISFLENNLTSLSDALLVPDQLIANSCIARSEGGAGSLVSTGRDGVSSTPDSAFSSVLATGTVQTTPSANNISTDDVSQRGTLSIEEPTEIYQLADGRLVMGKACL